MEDLNFKCFYSFLLLINENDNNNNNEKKLLFVEFICVRYCFRLFICLFCFR